MLARPTAVPKAVKTKQNIKVGFSDLATIRPNPLQTRLRTRSRRSVVSTALSNIIGLRTSESGRKRVDSASSAAASWRTRLIVGGWMAELIVAAALGQAFLHATVLLPRLSTENWRTTTHDHDAGHGNEAGEGKID